jgi:hypothetical protein
MSDYKKLLITALAVILLAGATPLAAELDGTWEGNGEGSCETPTGIIIYPWETWYGDVLNGAFDGNWEDPDGNYGTFHGGIIFFYISVEPPSYTMAHCEGTWTWMSPDGLEPIEMGGFSMEFNLGLEICDGEWWPYSGAEGGTMWGWRIGN